jgi:hypothetical protein
MAIFQCVDHTLISYMSLFQLEAGCDRLPLPAGGDTSILGMQDLITAYGKKRNVEIPTQTFTKTVSGATCPEDVGCSVDNGTEHVFGFCREPAPLKALAGYESVTMTAGTVDGGAEESPGCVRNFAAMIVFAPPKNCAVGVTPLCRAVFIPYLSAFQSADTITIDQNATPIKSKETWTARYFRNTNVLQNYATYLSLPASIRAVFPAARFAQLQSGKAVWADVPCPVGLVSSACTTVPIA